MVAELVTTAIQSTASSLIGSASGSAAEKGAKHPAMDKQPQSVKVGLKASEILVSSLMTSIAVTIFNRMSKDVKGYSFVTLAVALSSISAIVAAYIKIRL
jgi:hypothetical protein